MAAGRFSTRSVAKITLLTVFLFCMIFLFPSSVKATPQDYTDRPSEYYRISVNLAWMSIAVILTSAILIIVLLLNIVRSRKTEMMHQESEERYRLLFEYSPSAAILHKGGLIVFANPAGARLFGADHPNELVGRSMLDFIHPQHRKPVQGRIADIEGMGSVLPPVQIKLVKGDGMVDVESTSILFRHKGEKMVLSVIRDITPWKQLKEAIELDKLKTEFLSNISHELRTPLNLILSTLQLSDLRLKHIHNDEMKNVMIKHLSILKQNSLRLLKLVNNLIDTTEIQAGDVGLDMGNYDIVTIAEDITMLVADKVKDWGIYLTFDTEFEEKMIACDIAKLERAILNLLSNAVKFSRTGGHIAVTLYEEEGNILISVKDDGIGIPASKIREVFEYFKSVDRLFTRNHEGSGMGLSIARSLVELQGGDIFLRSDSGKGCEFTVKLPGKVLEDRPSVRRENAVIRRQDYIDKINIEFSDIFDTRRLS